jgi:D-psicose/D-tagatose/L-ribulose 3-epimerase
MNFGMNLLLWTGDVTEAHTPVLAMLKNIGYDGVEIPIFNLDADYKALGKRLSGLGLRRTGVTIRNGEDNPISSDAGVRKKGVELNKKTLDCAAAAGVETLVGPYHSAIGVFSGAGRTQDEWKWGVESMRAVAEHAGKVGVMLGVEPLNRFETYLLNTHSDAAKFVREVNHPNCRMMYDTFHSNIEEKCAELALNSCKDVLCHIHISENDRSTPGKGGVKWNDNWNAIRDINYNGWLVVEAFGLALPEIAAATKIWRKMFESEEQLATDALAFMRAEVAKRW